MNIDYTSLERKLRDLRQKRRELEQEMRKEICQKLGHLWMTKTKTVSRHEKIHALQGCKCKLKITRKCRICGEIGDISYKEGYPDLRLLEPIPEEYQKELQEMKVRISETELEKE